MRRRRKKGGNLITTIACVLGGAIFSDQIMELVSKVPVVGEMIMGFKQPKATTNE